MRLGREIAADTSHWKPLYQLGHNNKPEILQIEIQEVECRLGGEGKITRGATCGGGGMRQGDQGMLFGSVFVKWGPADRIPPC